MERDYYEVLQIRKDATISEIKLSYKRLIHKYHPDISKTEDNIMKFKEVIKAYKILSNPIKRVEYDKKNLNVKRSKNRKKNIDRDIKNNFMKLSKDKSNKVKYLFSEIFNKKKLNDLFFNIKVARNELRRKKFVDRELSKISVSFSSDELYNNMSDIDIKARLKNKYNHFIRINAVKIIAYNRDRQYIFELVKLLSDESPLVRKEVIKTLGMLKDYRSLNFIINSSFDYDDDVRIEVAKSLRNFEDIRAVSGLLKLLDDINEEVIIEAVYSLGVIGDKDVVEDIRKLLKKRNIKLRRAVFEVVKILRE
ncbi:HEAT repeat domain-containing protein [Haliovirga abyssi]|uniref:J domain-containing protein n=1 Tax=Haliovirga abyssi TaxID=2996794 RepID=A0AAU9D7J6_9FUSO|nr:HEAT repeat domain-containing protein [Haliovirga abyssi]BDU50553.1 hypothetical protein HLVA_11220 [Haliovirga abyssi]